MTQPLAPAIIKALHKAVDEMGAAETFHGYAPDLGYEFLRSAIAKNDYQDRGCDIAADEIFVSDGQSATAAISRRSLDRTIGSLSATRYIPCMWTPMLWPEGQETGSRRRKCFPA